jgi:hypothetical protein
MKLRRGLTLGCFLVLLVLCAPQARAEVVSGMDVTLAYGSVTVYGHNVAVANFNGVYAYYDCDRTRCWDLWACNEYPTRYYSQLYGVDLSDFFAWPVMGYADRQVRIDVTYDPQPGDIVLAYPSQRTGTSYYHAAIVKSVGRDALTLIEQNYGYWQNGFATAYVDRVIPWAASPDSTYGKYYDTYYVFRVTVKDPYTYFEDVPDGHWAAAAVNALYEQGVLSGKSADAFCPDDTVTRAEFAAMLYKLCAQKGQLTAVMDTPDLPVSFYDVADSAWYAGVVRWAAQSGLMGGDGAGAFHPGDAISRQDMAVVLSRLVQKLRPDLATGTADLTAYRDADTIAAYARPHVALLTGLGILTPYNGSLYPRYTPSRAETAVLLYRVWSL